MTYWQERSDGSFSGVYTLGYPGSKPGGFGHIRICARVRPIYPAKHIPGASDESYPAVASQEHGILKKTSAIVVTLVPVIGYEH